MLLVMNPNLPVANDKFEQGDHIVLHDLRRDRSTGQVGKLLRATGYVLQRLNCAEATRSSLCLDRNDELPAGSAHPDVKLVDLNLAHILHRGAQMILQRVSDYAEKDVYQPVVANLRKLPVRR